MTGWEPKVGDWVTVLPPGTGGDAAWSDWDQTDPTEPQGGQVLQVVAIYADPDDPYVDFSGDTGGAYYHWIRPATQEEIAASQLASLPGGQL